MTEPDDVPPGEVEPQPAVGRHAAGPPDAPGPGELPGPGAGIVALIDALDTLRARLGALRLPLETPGAAVARADLARAVDQLDDYLLPRLRAERAPLLVVVGGSTGAGKSTLVNSLLGEQVSAPGVLRPTTRAPVLVHHPLDARWFTTDRVLPGLARVTTDRSDAPRADARPASDAPPSRSLRLVRSDALPQGLALLDAPDIDSVETANRELAAQLLGAADLWLFVTTAARYADAVPWDLLLHAAARKAQVAMVLDRVDPGSEQVADDLRRLMAEHGLADAQLFVVPEAADAGPGALEDGYLPEETVGEIATWLTGLGGDPEARARVIAATRDGVVDDLVRRAVHLADAADTQRAADTRLRDAVRRHHADALAQVDAATSDGALLRGEVLARWQDFVGTGEFFRSVEAGVGRVRDAVVDFFRGKPRQAPQVEQAIAHGLESVVLDAAEQAAERTYQTWRGDAAGAALLQGLELSRTSGGLRAQVGEEIRGWQSDVLELVREQGAEKRGTARALSLGVNALGVSLMVLVFASTAGLTGAEIGIAGGTAVVAQKLLEAVFGDEAVRRLSLEAKKRLTARVQSVLDGQAARYTAQLDALGTQAPAGDAVREAARAVEGAARAERSVRPAGAGGSTRAFSGGMLRGAGTLRRPTTDGVPRADAGPAVDEPGTGAPERRPGFWSRLLGRKDSGS